MTAADLLKLELIDGIVPEPPGGAHTDPAAAAEALGKTLRAALAALAGRSATQLIDERYAKFRRMGNFFSDERLGAHA
jgi:acetyl-CoA carboxylase alpha subunit